MSLGAPTSARDKPGQCIGINIQKREGEIVAADGSARRGQNECAAAEGRRVSPLCRDYIENQISLCIPPPSVLEEPSHGQTNGAGRETTLRNGRRRETQKVQKGKNNVNPIFWPGKPPRSTLQAGATLHYLASARRRGGYLAFSGVEEGRTRAQPDRKHLAPGIFFGMATATAARTTAASGRGAVK